MEQANRTRLGAIGEVAAALGDSVDPAQLSGILNGLNTQLEAADNARFASSTSSASLTINGDVYGY